ncbi:MAG: hypothetical protein ACLQVM_13735 [Terriglobia bacterium]
MIEATLILVISAGLALFYLQVTCETVLAHEFKQCYFESVVRANQLEFASLRKSVAENGVPGDRVSLFSALQGDFLVLSYLLKQSGERKRRYTSLERVLMTYFRLMLVSLRLRHAFKLQEKPAVLKLAALLQYFANVVGRQTNEAATVDLAVSR